VQGVLLETCLRVLRTGVHPTLGAAVYGVSVILSALILTRFYPPQHAPGTPVFLIAALIAAFTQAAVYVGLAGTFYLVARHRGIRPPWAVVTSGVVVAHLPSLVFQGMILLVPGFALVEPTSRLLIAATSPAAWFPGVASHAALARVFNTFELWNIAKVLLLSVVLQSTARLSFAQAVILNLLVGLALATLT